MIWLGEGVGCCEKNENWVGKEKERKEKIVKKWSKNGSRDVQNQKFSYSEEGDTPSPGPHPPQPRPCGPRRVSSALWASLKVAAATCPPKFQVPSHFFILRRPDINICHTMYFFYLTTIPRAFRCVLCTCKKRMGMPDAYMFKRRRG